MVLELTWWIFGGFSVKLGERGEDGGPVLGCVLNSDVWLLRTGSHVELAEDQGELKFFGLVTRYWNSVSLKCSSPLSDKKRIEFGCLQVPSRQSTKVWAAELNPCPSAPQPMGPPTQL